MKKDKKSMMQLFFSWNFIKFLLIGAFNTLNGTVFSYLYSSMLDANLAFVVGYITSLLIAYVLNSVWNFKVKMTWQGFGKFIISYIPNFIIQNIVVFVTYNILGCHKLIAYFFAAVLGIPITYILVKVFAMKKE